MSDYPPKRLRFDVQAEREWKPVDKTRCSLCGCRGAHFCTGGQESGPAYTSGTKRYDNDLPPDAGWMS